MVIGFQRLHIIRKIDILLTFRISIDCSFDQTIPGNLDRFLTAHSGRQGIAVLGFNTNDVDKIYEKYRQLHPTLVHKYCVYENDRVKCLQVFAYYQSDEKEADVGTLIRFVESMPDKGKSTCSLPGLTKVAAFFDQKTQAAYCDHWVSNVFSRTQFLDTLESTLGFTPKVSKHTAQTCFA